MPQASPRIGAVKAEDIMLAMVITAEVPRTGYAGNRAHTRTNATHIAVKAKNTELVMYFWPANTQPPDVNCFIAVRFFTQINVATRAGDFMIVLGCMDMSPGLCRIVHCIVIFYTMLIKLSAVRVHLTGPHK